MRCGRPPQQRTGRQVHDVNLAGRRLIADARDRRSEPLDRCWVHESSGRRAPWAKGLPSGFPARAGSPLSMPGQRPRRAGRLLLNDEMSPELQDLSVDGRGWFRTSDLSRVKRALSH